MKKRKLLSTAVAGTLVAAQMAMPVMAAGGQVDVNVTTKNPVLRVEVPTKLEIAVDQFETVETGSQIYSQPFTMKNKSTVAVKVEVTSTAQATATLVDSPVDLGTGEAWLAVAAQTEAGKYGVASLENLSGANANVESLDASTKTAVQNFYLEKGSEDVVYKILDVGTTVPDNGASYAAEYIEITAPGTAYTGDADLRTALASQDVYVEAADGTVTRLTSADADTATYVSGNTYYEAGAATSSVAASKKYVYAESKSMATTGGEAAFRYIGKLSDDKSGGWSATDISKITIAYDIQGASASVYDSVKDDCTYGLYTAPTAPSIAQSDLTQTLTAGTALNIPVNFGAGSLKATRIASVGLKVGDTTMDAQKYVTFADGVLTLPAAVVDTMLGSGSTYLPSKLVITFNDADETSFEVDLSAATTANP